MLKRTVLASLSVLLITACQPSGAPADGAASDSKSAEGAARPAATRAPAPPKLTLAAGTPIVVVLKSPVSSASNTEGDTVIAALADDLRIGERVVAPAGSEVRGRVTAAVRSGKTKGRARLAFAFDSLDAKGHEVAIATTPVDITAENTHKKDAAIIGGATAGGAILGAIIDGKKGAAIGAGVGAAGGTGTVLATRGKEVLLPAGQSITVKLTESATF
jgi:hypothetical protein